jgi:hypothetical protein
MLQLRKLTLALPFAFALAACSRSHSSGDTSTAAGSIGSDTSAVRADTNPLPGAIPDTGMKATAKDSAMMDSMKRDSTRKHHAAKKAKKPY